MRVAVLYNAVPPDDSEDNQDTLAQVRAVTEALAALGVEPMPLECTLDLAGLRDRLVQAAPQAVFNLVESLGGSDWLIHLVPGLLDVLRLPYTGSPTEAILLSTHKLLAKQRLREAGLPTPAWLSLSPPLPSCPLTPLPSSVPPPLVLKTVWEHASFALGEDSIIQQAPADWQTWLAERSRELRRPCFLEQYIDGREFNLSLLAAADGVQVLPPAEIDFSGLPAGKARIVGYRAKWNPESPEFQATPRRFDFPDSDQPLLSELGRLATACWERFGLCGYARVDFRVDHQGQPWILEINANPCLSPDAGFAAALAQAGVSFPQAVERILDQALGTAGSRGESQSPLARSAGEGLGVRAVCPKAVELAPTPTAGDFRYEVEPADRQLVRQIVESTGFFNPAEIAIAVELVEERLAKGDASGYHFVFASCGGQAGAYACYGPIAGTLHAYDLYWIAVHPAHQNQGVGARLLAQTEQCIRRQGGRQVYAETSSRDQYAPTRRFYQRHGYQRVAQLKDFYAPGDDKLIYVKEL